MRGNCMDADRSLMLCYWDNAGELCTYYPTMPAELESAICTPIALDIASGAYACCMGYVSGCIAE